jgi:hypothetical protein
MTAPGRKPKPIQGRGEIHRDAVYPISVLMRRLGIARNTLTSLRKRGLPVRYLGRRCALVYGWELLDFLRAESDQSIHDALPDTANAGENGATVPESVPERLVEQNSMEVGTDG